MRYPNATISKGSVPFGPLQSNDVATLCSTGSQQGVDVADTISAVDRCCANVDGAECGLVQPRPRPDGLVFLAGGLPLRPLPVSLLPSKCPPHFTQFQVFSTQLLAFVLPTCWVQHSQHASTFPSSTLLLTRVCPPSILLSSLRVPRFPPHGCRGKRFRFVGLHHHQSMLLAGLGCQYRRVLASIDVMKGHRFMRDSIVSTPSNCCCRLPWDLPPAQRRLGTKTVANQLWRANQHEHACSELSSP